MSLSRSIPSHPPKKLVVDSTNCGFVDITYQSVQTTEGLAKVPTMRMKRALESHRSSLITCIASANACQFQSDLSQTFAILELVHRNVAYIQGGRSLLPTVLCSSCLAVPTCRALASLPCYLMLCALSSIIITLSSSSCNLSTMAESLGRLTDRSVNRSSRLLYLARAYVTRMQDDITI